MKFLKTLILFLWAFNLEAQVEAILKDPNIVWAAELELDFKVDKTSDTLSNKLNNIALIKLLRNEMLEDTNEDYFLSEHIKNAVDSNRLSIFEDSSMKIPLSYIPPISIDTLISTDPPHYSNSLIISIVRYKIADFKLFRVRQLIYYDSSKAIWNMKTIAIAPLVLENDTVKNYKPLFWMAVENEIPNIASEDIVWAKRLTTFSNNTLAFCKAKILKETNEFPMSHFFNRVFNDYEMPLYESIKCNEEDRFTIVQRKILLTRTDTIMEFNPVTYEAKLKINTVKIDEKGIKYLQLVQEWFWDKKKSKLFIHLSSIAPLWQMVDDKGNYLFDKPLFYRKTKDD